MSKRQLRIRGEADQSPIFKAARIKRKRKPNITQHIMQARKAGERGPVRVEFTDANGNPIVVTSSSQPEATTVDPAPTETSAQLLRLIR